MYGCPGRPEEKSTLDLVKLGLGGCEPLRMVLGTDLRPSVGTAALDHGASFSVLVSETESLCKSATL